MTIARWLDTLFRKWHLHSLKRRAEWLRRLELMATRQAEQEKADARHYHLERENLEREAKKVSARLIIEEAKSRSE